ncbi:MAG: SLC13 family permease [Verrucomicrobiota bacterium]|nr:SLC13 family permease [Verrucomicrobiota bacterium]
MDFNQIVVCLLLILVFVAFVKEWFSPDLVAMGAFVLLIGIGILDEKSALSVFSNPAPIIVSCMFVLSAALERTGTIEALGEWFEKLAGRKELRVLLVLMLIVAVLSAFVNNTPVVVVFMPIVLALARKHDLVASRFLIPLSYAAIVGGTCTIIGTSTNLVASGIAKESGLEEFGMFEVSKLGIVFVIVTFIYMLFIGRKLLPDRVTLSTLFDSNEGKEFLTSVIISDDSELIGKKISETSLSKIRNFRVLEVSRSGKKINSPLKEITFSSGDKLLVKSRIEGVVDAGGNAGVELGIEGGLGLQELQTESAVLIEGVIGPGSSLLGRSIKELNFRERYDVIILALHRRGVNLRDKFENVRLAFGDTILVEGSPDKINALSQERDFINLSQSNCRPLRRSKVPFAVGALLLFMLLAAFKVAPLIVLALGAALLTLFSKCLEPSEAYDAIDWKVIFMIFGMLGLGTALQKVEVIQMLADSLTGWAMILKNIYVLVALIYLATAILTELISNNAVAALLTPVAISVAQAMDLDPRPLVVAVMFAASASFSTPIGYQTNTYIYGAGGYKFTDFTRVGIPLTIILWAVSIFFIPLMWS